MPIQNITVELFNTAGRSIVITRPNSHTFSIETGNLPAGLYIAVVKSEGRVAGRVRVVKR